MLDSVPGIVFLHQEGHWIGEHSNDPGRFGQFEVVKKLFVQTKFEIPQFVRNIFGVVYLTGPQWSGSKIEQNQMYPLVAGWMREQIAYG